MDTKKETTINDRIQQIIDHYNLNKNSFSREIGLGNNMTITNIVGSRKSKPGYDVLRKIAECFPVNPGWLLTGKGAMFTDTEDALKSEDIETERIANAIVHAPEKFEKNPVFARYLESKCANAIVANQNELLLNFKKLGLG